MSEDFLFADPDQPVGRDDATGSGEPRETPWRVLIVDDDPEVHNVTRLALNKARFKGRPLELVNAHSGEEARRILADDPDIAAVLLDVVMETDQAGLDVVRYVRDTLGNHRVQIILRTGQPGQAPEREVIDAYEINDYKAKTELTSEKLYTAAATAIRAYSYIDTIEANRRGLSKIIDASASLFQVRSMKLFASGALTQIAGLLSVPHDGLLCVQQTADLVDEPVVLAGAGDYENAIDRPLNDAVPDTLRRTLMEALASGRNIYTEDGLYIVIRPPSDRAVGLYLPTQRTLSEQDQQLVEVFCSKIAVGFDNLHLYEDLCRAHEATVIALASLAEFKDEDTGDHVRRVERRAISTAQVLKERGNFAMTVDDAFVGQIGLAAILHDIGKVAVPDAVLQKPGRLDPEEWQIMKTHAQQGADILAQAARGLDPGNYLDMGAVIAATHHEKYDGNGYPEGLAGESIPVAGRIVAVVDVFDALTSRRPYKEPWSHEDAVAEIKRSAGSHFDPTVVDAFLEALAREEGADAGEAA